MRHQTSRNLGLYVERPTNSASTSADLRTADVRRVHEDALIGELAHLEEKIRLKGLDDDEGEVVQPSMQDLVAAEYTILHELRRRQTLLRQGIEGTAHRPRRSRRRWS
jgi:hypothetical protein